MGNERITEGFVRDHFNNDPLLNAIKIEEQKTTVPKAKKCLSKASKNQTGNIGFPEFIITVPSLPDDIIICECKADKKFHASKGKDNPVSYAVDGALHYSKFLSSDFNVISLAVSGEEEGRLKISSFYQKQGEAGYKEEDSKLLSIYSYITRFKGKDQAKNIENIKITRTAIDLNNELNDYSIVEYERCTLISAILLALQDEGFKTSYKAQAQTADLTPRPDRVAKAIVDGIKRVLQDNDIDSDRVVTMVSEYEKIKNRSIAKGAQIKKKKGSVYQDNYVLRDIIADLEKTILPLMTMGDKGYDVLGRFYTEFIRYAGTDKKTGLVLTPQHITEFFCDLVSLNINDVVVDSCCGTGGFLISAMKRMLELAGNDQKKKKHIKQKQLIGIEKRTDMFTFACSNMMMSGDGKSHIYEGDSFSEESKDKIKSLKPTVAFLNPPYDVGEDGQLEFIENALSGLQHGGRCAAIVQMSCAISSNSSSVNVRERLLKDHTLQGVFSMPTDLFYPVGVVTCIMVFQAHNPHPKKYKTFFGCFKDDGFIKSKTFGRSDDGDWQTIKTRWLNSFINRESEPGLSILRSVTAGDEWCAESYIKTDYSTLNQKKFIAVVKDYVAFQFSSGKLESATNASFNNIDISFDFSRWDWFQCGGGGGGWGFSYHARKTSA